MSPQSLWVTKYLQKKRGGELSYLGERFLSLTTQGVGLFEDFDDALLLGNSWEQKRYTCEKRMWDPLLADRTDER